MLIDTLLHCCVCYVLSFDETENSFAGSNILDDFFKRLNSSTKKSCYNNKRYTANKVVLKNMRVF